MKCPHCGGFIPSEQETGRKPIQKKEFHSFTLNVGIVRDLAFNVNDGVEEFWIPKSQITTDIPMDEIKVGDTVTFEIPEWLARKKGLLDEKDDIPF